MTKPRQRESLIVKANREISVFDVLKEFFGVHHPRDGRSFKGYCPFVWQHFDGGTDKGFRTYPATNSAYCFVQCGSLVPVRLIQLQKDWTAQRSARWLLEHYGLLQDKPWPQRWKDLTQAPAGPELGSPDVLVAALHQGLSDHPSYPPSGLSPALAQAMEVELDRLAELYEEGSTATTSDVREWFDRAKTDLREVLDGHEGVSA